MNEQLLTPGVTAHHGHMPEITILSDTEAEGILAMFDYVQIPSPSGRVSIMGYGHYFETYRKCDDGKWRISSSATSDSGSTRCRDAPRRRRARIARPHGLGRRVARRVEPPHPASR